MLKLLQGELSENCHLYHKKLKMELVIEAATQTEKDFAAILPEHARVWIYAANRFFSNEETAFINQKAQQFAAQWAAHKVQLFADAAVLYNCFLVLAVDEKAVGTSGCSIDSSIGFVKEMGKQFNADFLNRQLVYFKKGSKIEIYTLSKAAEAYKAGSVTADTAVFNHLVNTKQTLQKNWLAPLYQTPQFKLIESPIQEFAFKL